MKHSFLLTPILSLVAGIIFGSLIGSFLRIGQMTPTRANIDATLNGMAAGAFFLTNLYLILSLLLRWKCGRFGFGWQPWAQISAASVLVVIADYINGTCLTFFSQLMVIAAVILGMLMAGLERGKSAA